MCRLNSTMELKNLRPSYWRYRIYVFRTCGHLFPQHSHNKDFRPSKDVYQLQDNVYLPYGHDKRMVNRTIPLQQLNNHTVLFYFFTCFCI